VWQIPNRAFVFESFFRTSKRITKSVRVRPSENIQSNSSWRARHPRTMKIQYPPLPLAGEGGGEGGPLSFPLTLFLSPEGRGRFRGAIFYVIIMPRATPANHENNNLSLILRYALCDFLCNQHRIPIAVKTVPLLDGFFVGGQNSFSAGKGGDQHQKRRPRQVKIRHHGVNRLKFMPGKNE